MSSVNPAELRKSLGLSQQDFAHELGCSVSSIQKWEAGQSVPNRMASKLLEVLATRGVPAGKTAAEDALDDIAAMCGCSEWVYPGQVVRDVRAEIAKREALESILSNIRDALDGKPVEDFDPGAATTRAVAALVANAKPREMMTQSQAMAYIDDSGRYRCPSCSKFLKSLHDARPIGRLPIQGGSMQLAGACIHCTITDTGSQK